MPFLKLLIIFFVIFVKSFANFEENKTFNELETFLNSIKTIKGGAVQTLEGQKIILNFFIKVPKKIRTEYYVENNKYATILNNGVAIFYDFTLNQTSQAKIPENLKSLLGEKLSLKNKFISILDFKENGNDLFLKLKNQSENTFEIFIKKEGETFVLNKIIISYGNSLSKINIDFKNIIFNEDIPDKIFFINKNKIDSNFNF